MKLFNINFGAKSKIQVDKTTFIFYFLKLILVFPVLQCIRSSNKRHCGINIENSCSIDNFFTEKIFLFQKVWPFEAISNLDTYNLNFTHSKYVDLLQHMGLHFLLYQIVNKTIRFFPQVLLLVLCL